MINQSTIDKLVEMHLTSMADAFRIQLNDASMKEVPFEDRFGLLVDVEYTSRKNNRLETCEYITEYRNIFITGASVIEMSVQKGFNHY